MMRFMPPAFAVLGLAMLSGCASAGAGVTAVSGPVASIATFTQTDLAAAIKMAQAATPPDTEAVTCFSYISGDLTTLQGQVSGTAVPTGAFSAFETVNLALDNAGSAISPASKTALEVACGPLAAHVVNTGASMVSEVATLLGQVGIHVAVP